MHNIGVTTRDHVRFFSGLAAHPARTRVTDSLIVAVSRAKYPAMTRHDPVFDSAAFRLARDSTKYPALLVLICTVLWLDLRELSSRLAAT